MVVLTICCIHCSHISRSHDHHFVCRNAHPFPVASFHILLFSLHQSLNVFFRISDISASLMSLLGCIYLALQARATDTDALSRPATSRTTYCSYLRDRQPPSPHQLVARPRPTHLYLFCPSFIFFLSSPPLRALCKTAFTGRIRRNQFAAACMAACKQQACQRAPAKCDCSPSSKP